MKSIQEVQTKPTTFLVALDSNLIARLDLLVEQERLKHFQTQIVRANAVPQLSDEIIHQAQNMISCGYGVRGANQFLRKEEKKLRQCLRVGQRIRIPSRTSVITDLIRNVLLK